MTCVYFTIEDGRIKKLSIVAFCILSSTVVAYATTVLLAGGYQVYSAAVVRVMGYAVQSKSIFAGAPATEHIHMLLKLTVWLVLISLPAFIASAYCWKKYRYVVLSSLQCKQLILISASWMLPPLALFSFVYFLKPTYLLVVLPPIILIFTTSIFFILKNHHKIYPWLCVFILAGFATINVLFNKFIMAFANV